MSTPAVRSARWPTSSGFTTTCASSTCSSTGRRCRTAGSCAPTCHDRAWGSSSRRSAENLGEVQRATAGSVGDLLAAREAVGDERRAQLRVADRWEEAALADAHRQVELLGLEAERARQAAAARAELALAGRARGLQQLELGVHPDDRLLMAVAVQDHLAA